MQEERSPIPGYMLIGAGGLSVLYSLFYSLWTVLSMLSSLKNFLFYDLPFMMEYGDFEMMKFNLPPLLAGFVQLLVFLFLLVLAGATMYGGNKLANHQGKRAIIIGAGSAIVLPIIGILTNYAHLVTGFLTGLSISIGYAMSNVFWGVVSGSMYNMPTFVLLAANIGIASFAVYTITRPEWTDLAEEPSTAGPPPRAPDASVEEEPQQVAEAEEAEETNKAEAADEAQEPKEPEESKEADGDA